MFNNLKLAILQALQMAARPVAAVEPPPLEALRNRFRKYNAWQANRHNAKKPH